MSELTKSELVAEKALFDRVVSILEQARIQVVRAVNINMVGAYWLIGREIVEALQGGDARAEYGKHIIQVLSARLTRAYGKGFSAQTLWNFRQLYQSFPDRCTILSPPGRELAATENLYPTGRESASRFSPLLSWSHYRALMRVQDEPARQFYEQEAIDCGWSKTQLERQIQTAYYQRIVAKYLQFLPSEEQLRIELEKEQRLIKAAIDERREQNDHL